MAHCPNCSAQVAIISTDCPKCGAVFADGAGWQPVPESPEEERRSLERPRAIASTLESVPPPTERITSKLLWLLHGLAATCGSALVVVAPFRGGLAALVSMGLGFGASWAFASWVNGLPVSKTAKIVVFWLAPIAYFLIFLALFVVSNSLFGRAY